MLLIFHRVSSACYCLGNHSMYCTWVRHTRVHLKAAKRSQKVSVLSWWSSYTPLSFLTLFFPSVHLLCVDRTALPSSTAVQHPVFGAFPPPKSFFFFIFYTFLHHPMLPWRHSAFWQLRLFWWSVATKHISRCGLSNALSHTYRQKVCTQLTVCFMR